MRRKAKDPQPTILETLIMPPDPEPEPPGPLSRYWDADGQLIAPGVRVDTQEPIPPNEMERCPTHTAPGRPCDGSYTNCPPRTKTVSTYKSETVRAIIEDGPKQGKAWVTVRRADHIPPARLALVVKGVTSWFRRVDHLPVLTYRHDGE